MKKLVLKLVLGAGALSVGFASYSLPCSRRGHYLLI